jgi:hypothetical protein
MQLRIYSTDQRQTGNTPEVEEEKGGNFSIPDRFQYSSPIDVTLVK